MAKKKVTHHHHNQQQDENNVKSHNLKQREENKGTAMDEDASAEKLERLKSLNSMLLKQAVENRQLVDSLEQAKGSLESELTRSKSEKDELVAKLDELSEKGTRFEMERSIVFAFVGLQVKQRAEALVREREEMVSERIEIERKMTVLGSEMSGILKEKSEIEKARDEKDGEILVLNEKIKSLVNEINNEKGVSEKINLDMEKTKAELDVQIKGVKELSVKLIEMEQREKQVQEEVEELGIKYKSVVAENEEKHSRIEALLREKASIEYNLSEANRMIDEMKGKIAVIVKEKEGIVEEANVEKAKRGDLEITVSGLNETVSSLKKMEEALRDNVAELEKKCAEGVEKQNEMGREIDDLTRGKNEMEKRLEGVVEEKGLVEKNLDEILKQLEEHKQKTEVAENEKFELLEAKNRKESEIGELQQQVAECRDAIKKLEETCNHQMEKMKNYESEVDHNKDALTQVTIERDEARKGFDAEKKIVLELKQKVEEMEKSILEKVKLVEEIKAESVSIIGEKGKLESSYKMLKKELERLLKLLKSTSELVCSNDERKDVDGENKMNGGGGAEAYMVELELIKSAFKSRESKVENMTRQVEFLKNSAAEAQKQKSFLTLLSSATTMLATISLAYILRGH